MNDYEKTIKALQNRVGALEERLMSCDNAVVRTKNWQPVSGDWWIDCLGNVSKGDTSFDIRHFGHERPTLLQAERAAIKMRKFNRLLALRDELCGDDVVDWNDDSKSKFYVAYNTEAKMWMAFTSLVLKSTEPFFTTKDFAQLACDMLNSGEVKL
jgi:hypothetical protein